MAIASSSLRFFRDRRDLFGTQPAARADCGREPRAVSQRLTGRRGRGHLCGPLLWRRGCPLPCRSGRSDNGSDGCRDVAAGRCRTSLPWRRPGARAGADRVWCLASRAEPPGSDAAGASSGNKDHALPTGGRALFAAGLLGMLTNFTTLPLYLSVAQRIGTVAAPWWARALLLVLVIVVVALPVWLPVGLRAVVPGHSRIGPETRRRIQTATQRISIGACFLGGAVIIWHVVKS